MKKKKYLTILNVIACFCVVMMHVNRGANKFSMESYWFGANLIDCLCYFAVPVFFMSSGANLLDYTSRYDTKTFFKKRIEKVLVPFLFWSLMAMFYLIARAGTSGRSVGSLLMGIVNTEYISTYWFFIPLFMAYLTMPVFAAIEHKKQIFGYIICIGGILNYALPWVTGIFGKGYNSDLRFPALSGYVIFVLIGYYIDHYEIPKVWRYVIYVLGLMGLLSMIMMTYKVSTIFGGLYTGFKGYLNLPAVCYGSAMFLAFKNIKSEKVLATLEKICGPVSGVTFGIYLLHRGVIEVVEMVSPIESTSLVYRLLGSVVVFVLSGVLVKVMQQIPLVKRLVP